MWLTAADSKQDDFYLNLVSWSASNVLAVGLNSRVYLWSAASSKVTQLCDMSGEGAPRPGDTVTGLEWTNRVRAWIGFL